MAQVRRIQRIARRVWTAIRVDLAPDVRRPLEDHDDPLLLGQLDDLHGVRRAHQTPAAGSGAIPSTVAFRHVLGGVVADPGAPALASPPRLPLAATPTPR